MFSKIKNFFEGCFSAFSLFPVSRKHKIGSGIIGRKDEDALRSDWEKVGEDMARATRKALDKLDKS